MRLLLTALLAVALAAGAAWYFELWEPPIPFPPTEGTASPPTKPSEDPPPDIGEALYPPKLLQPEPSSVPFASRGIPLGGGTLVVFDKYRVPSERDGVLLFVGEEREQADPGKATGYQTAQIMMGDKVLATKVYRPWKE